MADGGFNHENEQLRDIVPPQAQLSPEAFQDRAQIPGTVSDRINEAKLEHTDQAQLAYAQTTATEVANHYLLMEGPCSPQQFTVMKGVLHLGIAVGAWDDNNKQQINACLVERASQQQDPRAAMGLRSLGEKILTA